jgi:hypothetical protein
MAMRSAPLYDTMFLPAMLWMSWASKMGEMPANARRLAARNRASARRRLARL